jgi:hypothetical protein
LSRRPALHLGKKNAGGFIEADGGTAERTFDAAPAMQGRPQREPAEDPQIIMTYALRKASAELAE